MRTAVPRRPYVCYSCLFRSTRRHLHASRAFNSALEPNGDKKKTQPLRQKHQQLLDHLAEQKPKHGSRSASFTPFHEQREPDSYGEENKAKQVHSTENDLTQAQELRKSLGDVKTLKERLRHGINLPAPSTDPTGKNLTEPSTSSQDDTTQAGTLDAEDKHAEKLTNRKVRRVNSRDALATSNLGIATKQLKLHPLYLDHQLEVPSLSHNLSRVLFNPGVYYLQDPRSKVYNFDPYLERIMPVDEFDFEALAPYVTSSADTTLRALASEHGKKYAGSTSSMSGILVQFHLLLSAFRPLDFGMLSRNFELNTQSLTATQRAPCAIFLRKKDGIYAVDVDSQFDTENVLMNLGKSLEKFLTLDKTKFEQYRKTEHGSSSTHSTSESFHYTEASKFLLRSQLDAHDSRLPGTGMFDIKTRAALAIRADIHEYEQGMGYEIKDRFGLFESFEREYYDMARSVFLKWSLQVRMGRMDGVFVAFHNIARMFGFQYISLAELDHVLHGQSTSVLGDREFLVSIEMLSHIFDLATEEFGDQSMRFHFEARDSNLSEPQPFMMVYAEAMSEEGIQNLRDEADRATLSILEDGDVALESEENGKRNSVSEAPNDIKDPAGPMIGWKVRIQSTVNREHVLRPIEVKDDDDWNVKYELERLSPTTALSGYLQCRRRRKRVLEESPVDRDRWYLRNLRRLSERGAQWRKQQERHEAAREKIVL